MFNTRLFLSTILIAVFMVLFAFGELLPSEMNAASAKSFTRGGVNGMCCMWPCCNTIDPICGGNNYGCMRTRWPGDNCDIDSDNPCNFEHKICQGYVKVTGTPCRPPE